MFGLVEMQSLFRVYIEFRVCWINDKLTRILYYLSIWDSFCMYICLFICIPETICDYKM
jgi:hypothetical protein